MGTSTIPLVRYLGVRHVEPAEPGAVVSMVMECRDEVLNLVGNPHGGAIAALIDHAGGTAVAVALGRGGPTADLQVRYLRPAVGAHVRADATILRAGRRLAVVEVRVLDEEGHLAAIGTMAVAPRTSGTGPATSQADD